MVDVYKLFDKESFEVIGYLFDSDDVFYLEDYYDGMLNSEKIGEIKTSKYMTKYELLDGIRKLLLDIPCCHNCPESHLDDAIGWMCKEQNWKELSELYGEDYNPYKIADECEYMKGWW